MHDELQPMFSLTVAAHTLHAGVNKWHLLKTRIRLIHLGRSPDRFRSGLNYRWEIGGHMFRRGLGPNRAVPHERNGWCARSTASSVRILKIKWSSHNWMGSVTPEHRTNGGVFASFNKNMRCLCPRIAQVEETIQRTDLPSAWLDR